MFEWKVATYSKIDISTLHFLLFLFDVGVVEMFFFPELLALSVDTLDSVSVLLNINFQQLMFLDQVMTRCQIFSVVVASQMSLDLTHPQLSVLNSSVECLCINCSYNQSLFLACFFFQLPEFVFQFFYSILDPAKILQIHFLLEQAAQGNKIRH